MFGNLAGGSAWSTIKVPIAVGVMEEAGGPTGLSNIERQQVTSALTASDNAAAASLWTKLGKAHGGANGAAASVGGILQDGGSRTTVSVQGRDGFSPYGQTDWSLRDQQGWMAAFAGGCVTAPAVSGEILNQMDDVVESQRWGLGSIDRPARFKGGWGPGMDGRYLVRQMGVIESDDGSRALAIAIAVRTPDGGFESGAAALTDVATWAADHLNPRAVRRRRC